LRHHRRIVGEQGQHLLGKERTYYSHRHYEGGRDGQKCDGISGKDADGPADNPTDLKGFLSVRDSHDCPQI
jgi:hypothetical protein